MEQPIAAKDLMSVFPPVSKTQWLQQIARDLKDRPLEDLTWQAPGDLFVPPFTHQDDFQSTALPLVSVQAGWEICEDITTSPQAGTVLEQTQAALQGGAESLCFHLDTPLLDDNHFSGILEGIYLDYIGLHFTGAGVTENPGAVLGLLGQAAQQRSLATAALRGSLHWNPGQTGTKKLIPDWRYVADLIRFSQEQFPQFRIFTIGNDGEQNDPVSVLVSLLQQCNNCMVQLTKKGVAPVEIALQIQFEINIGKSYFLEIAKIRALKILWFNLLKSWKIGPTWPVIFGQFDPEAYNEVLYTNMIRATTMSMSAVLGGVSRLTVLPYNAADLSLSAQSQPFARRIARNVQHLLKMESYLDVEPDPAAGSYYIEHLTRQIADQTWSKVVISFD